MLFNILAVITAAVIAFGRQVSVVFKFKPGLWFFRYFETKRVLFTIASSTSLLLGFVSSADFGVKIVSFVLWMSFTGFCFFFDMKHFFPEIVSVEKQVPKNADATDRRAVLGVKINNKKVAYGLDEILIPYHLIHDKVVTENLLITYCAMCKSALAFERKVNDTILSFKVAGVWRRNMIIVDDQTQSIWQQATGECIFGPLAGKRLQMIHSENTTLENWLKEHPKSKVVLKGKNARKGFFSKKFMLKGLKFVPTKVMMPGLSDISQLPPRETVFGIDYKGDKVAFPISKLKGKRTFKEIIGGTEVKLEFVEEANSLKAIDTETKEEITVQKHWWLGWKEFHPDSRI